MAWIDEAKRNATTLIVLGILTVIFGMLAIGMPFISGIAVTLYVGFLLLAMGVLLIITHYTWGMFTQKENKMGQIYFSTGDKG